LGKVAGRRLADVHRRHGVRVHLKAAVSQLRSSGSHVSGVLLRTGTFIDSQLVLVAIGSTPATGWLHGTGLPVGDGVICDSYCRVAENIFAVGDVARWYNPRFKRSMRVEHRTNVNEQAESVASNLLCAPTPCEPIPYFWSEQYDLRIQGYGIFPSGAEPRWVDGAYGTERFLVHYISGGKPVGALAWNMPRELRLARAVLDAANPRRGLAQNRCHNAETPAFRHITSL
jgi:3-phenylpropionate/trans-cinnamate dioxygenase ferredoxin reductase subunit